MNKSNYAGLKGSIDSLACEYYDLSRQGADTTNVKHKLLGKVFEYLSDRHKYSGSYDAESDLDIIGIEELYKVFSQAIEKWAPGDAVFSNYLFSIYNKRMLTALKKKNFENNNREAGHIDEDSDSEHEELFDSIKDDSYDSQTEDTLQIRNDITVLFSQLSEPMLAQKKKYENSPKFCYPIRFYTELITRSVYELGGKKAENIIPDKVLNIMDKDFAVFYLDASEINTFADIFRAELRPLSDFTMADTDSVEKCGYALKNVVYRKYVSMVKGKDVSDPAVSQQRKQFEQLLSLVRREHLNGIE